LAFILPLVAMLTKEPGMLQPDAFCEHTMQQNATVKASKLDYNGLLFIDSKVKINDIMT